MSDQDAPPPPPPVGGGKREAKAHAKAEKAHDKAMRPWFKKKRFIIPLGVVLLIVIIAATSGGTDDDPDMASGNSGEAAGEGPSDDSGESESSDDGNTKNTDLYPDRPDQQSDDHEAQVGNAVRLAGYTATVHGASMQTTPFSDGQIVVIDVSIENRDDGAQPYNTFDWRIQTPNGQVLDPTFIGDNLGSGDLVTGGSVEGQVSFEVEPGTYYVIYKPDAFNAARGIWQITVG